MEQQSNQFPGHVLKRLNRFFNGEIVFVAGISEIKRGIKPLDKINDIDAVITNLSPLKRHNIKFYFKENSYFKGIVYVLDFMGYKLDLFYSHNLPIYDIIDGVKYQTVKDNLEYYKNTLNLYPDNTKDNILSKINRLEEYLK